MRSSFVAVLGALVVVGSLRAQPAETVHEIGKAGLSIEGKIAADDAKVAVTVAPGKSGELPAKRHLVKLLGGKSYRVTMRSKDLDSFLVVQDSKGRQVAFDDDSDSDLDAELTLDVKEDAVYRIHAASLKGSGTFSLLVREAAAKAEYDPNAEHVVGKVGLTIEGRLAADDARVAVTVAPGKSGTLPAKRYLVKLLHGKSYRVTMRSKELDSFLVVQDAKGQQVAFDDDSGGGLDAELTLEAKEDAVFRVYAATLKGAGSFAMAIREIPGKAAKRDDPNVEHVLGKDGLAFEGRFAADDLKTKFIREDGATFELPAKRYLVKLLGGKTYFLAMRSRAVDSMLIVQDAQGRQVDFDNDGGKGFAAGLILVVKEDATYRVLALSQLVGMPFALTIRERKADDPPVLSPPERAQLLEALSTNNDAVSAYSRGDPEKALALAKQALAVRKKILGNQHPLTAASLNSVGFLLSKQGDLANAQQCLEQALEIRRSLFGELHRETADSLDGLGGLLWEQGNHAAARKCIEQGLDIRRKLFGPEHPVTALSLNNLGSVLQSMGQYEAARQQFDRALAIKLKAFGKDHPDTANTLSTLGVLLWHQGEFAPARERIEQGLAIRRKVFGERHPDTAASLNDLGSLFQAQGNYAAARTCFEQVLATDMSIHGEWHPNTANSLNNLATLFDSQGDYATARSLYERSLAIRKRVRGEWHLDTAVSLNNLGYLLTSQRDYAAARPLYEQALASRTKALGEQHPDTAISLANLGSLLADQGDYAAARPLLEKALSIRRKTLGERNVETAVSLNNIGELLASQGAFAEARPYYEQSLAINEKSLGEQHPITATALSNIAGLLRHQNKNEDARPYVEKALAIQRRSLDLAAAALSERQQFAMNEATRSILGQWLSTTSETPSLAAADYAAVLAWKGAVSARQQQLRILRREPSLAPLAERLRAKAVRLANLSSSVPGPANADVDRRAELVRLTEEMEKLEIELSARSAGFRDAQRSVAPTLALVSRTLPDDAVLVEYFEYGHGRTDPKRPGQWIFEQRLTAFVVARERPVVRVELGPADAIAAAVEDWRKRVLGKQPFDSQAADPGQMLRRLLWTPLEKHLANARTVLISPDGAVARIPFAALPGKAPGTYLLEDVTIAVVPLPRRLPLMAEIGADSEPPSLLLVGDVDYGAAPGKGNSQGTVIASLAPTRSGERGPRFEPLAQTKGEIDNVRTSFLKRFARGQVTPLEKNAATESAVRAKASEHRYLHIASHGFFAPPEILSATAPRARHARRELDLFGSSDVRGFHPGLLSGIVLAGANRPPAPGEDDGILTALEVATIDLAKTELVVLSACETGLGKSAGGEGILGLQRAFQIAGAGSVVASLWSVDDIATQVLMTRFYDNLWTRKMPKAEALREAQLFLLREAPQQGLLRGVPRLDAPETLPAADRRTPPFYWAAFVISGDWR
jgi:CHAT domain-containing protein/tetratricopeptide (TPR) repeat protein